MISNLFTFGGCAKYENKEVEALIHTAKTYLQRGVAIQYDMGDFKGTDDERRNIDKKQPEEYTNQNVDFLDCSSFAWGVYMSALDYDIKYDSTKALMNSSDDVKEFSYNVTGSETDDQKKDLEKQYLKTLKKGDLVVYRRSDGGHVMLYVGEDENLPNGHDIIHSTGNSYDNYEENGTIETMSVSELFDANNAKRYVFNGKIVWFGIIRPFNLYNKFDQPLPENTVNRMKNLTGVVAEKLCSVPFGGTVSLGGELTYTFSIKNNNETPVTLSVTDTIPTNTAFVSATDGGVNNNDNLSWNVEVQANSEKQVSYTVKVNDDVTLIGKTIYTDTATIGGVKFTCQKVYIGNTLTNAQMQTVKTNIENVKTTSLRGMDAINSIYSGLGVMNFEGSVTDVYNKLFEGNYFMFDSKYLKVCSPYLYLGYVRTSNKISDGQRAKIILPHYLMTGDVVILRDYDNNNLDMVYIFNGEKLVDVTSNDIQIVEDTFGLLQVPTAKNRNVTLAVLRPSLSIA